MRLARPVYESLPIIYMLIGGLAILLFYINPLGFAAKAAFLIGVLAETAALTLFLRRQDYRELSREYNGETIDLPSNLHG
jgi:Flp pilus assembly protein TadB